MASSRIRTPRARAASIRSSMGAMRPSADCTADTATALVPARTSSAIRSSGTDRTARSGRAANGNSSEVKSPSATRTSAPAGRDAATSPTK
ncbi:hypothetical protein [Actinomadura madurae]|uniref:hypothetical protein n=1 Tax=Actinomadura madurae TaxID=1993 RepID=UPI00355870CE